MLYVAVYGIGNGKPYIAYVVIEPCFAVCGTDQHHVDGWFGSLCWALRPVPSDSRLVGHLSASWCCTWTVQTEVIQYTSCPMQAISYSYYTHTYWWCNMRSSCTILYARRRWYTGVLHLFCISVIWQEGVKEWIAVQGNPSPERWNPVQWFIGN